MGGNEEKELFRPSSYQCRSIEKGWTEGDYVTVHSNIAVFSLGLTSLILYIKCRQTGGQRAHIYKGTGNISDVHHLHRTGSKKRKKNNNKKNMFFFIFICSFETDIDRILPLFSESRYLLSNESHPQVF